jgi:hypothetical protein
MAMLNNQMVVCVVGLQARETPSFYFCASIKKLMQLRCIEH